jgi:Transposase, Mutator family
MEVGGSMTWTWWHSWSTGCTSASTPASSRSAFGIDGTKHPLAVEEGSAENATLVTGLITGLRDRGLDVSKPILAVLDGAKALSRAVQDVFDKPLLQRCQQHYADLGIMPTWPVKPLVAAA